MYVCYSMLVQEYPEIHFHFHTVKDNRLNMYWYFEAIPLDFFGSRFFHTHFSSMNVNHEV